MGDWLCWPCRHGDHENCDETQICFCSKCWDNEDGAVDKRGSPEGAAEDLAAMVER